MNVIHLVLHTNELVEFDIYTYIVRHSTSICVRCYVRFILFFGILISSFYLEWFYLPFISVRFICFVNYYQRCCCRHCHNCCVYRFAFFDLFLFSFLFFSFRNFNSMNDNLWTSLLLHSCMALYRFSVRMLFLCLYLLSKWFYMYSKSALEWNTDVFFKRFSEP